MLRLMWMMLVRAQPKRGRRCRRGGLRSQDASGWIEYKQPRMSPVASCRAAFGILIFTIVQAVMLPLARSAWAGPVTLTATAGPNRVAVDEGAGSASANHSATSGFTSRSSSAFASPAGRLSVSASSTATPWQYRARAAFSVTGDTTFDYEPGFDGVPAEYVEVSLTGALTGTITGTGLGGTGSGEARVSVTGNLFTASPDDGGTPKSSAGGFSGTQGGSVRSFLDSQVISVSQFVSTGRFFVRRGQPVSFSASLSTQVFSDTRRAGAETGTVTANFSDTFEFDRENFFDIFTPGVTANAPSFGLVNNQLAEFIDTEPAPMPSSVPAPGVFSLLLLGLLNLAWRRRHALSA